MPQSPQPVLDHGTSIARFFGLGQEQVGMTPAAPLVDRVKIKEASGLIGLREPAGLEERQSASKVGFRQPKPSRCHCGRHIARLNMKARRAHNLQFLNSLISLVKMNHSPREWHFINRLCKSISKSREPSPMSRYGSGHPDCISGNRRDKSGANPIITLSAKRMK
jgi:hypothetical protein